MNELHFFFDFSSPFSYLAATQVEALAARNGAVVRFRPFLLGALFKAIGQADVPFFAMSEPKRRHTAADIFRWADHYGVPFKWPSRFPMNTVKALRMVLQLPEDGRAAFLHAVNGAYWADDRDINDDATLVAIASELGLDGAALLAGTRSDDVKAQLKAATDEAVRLGLFGAPTFLVGKLLFWGQDRLVFVEKALQGWTPKGEQM